MPFVRIMLSLTLLVTIGLTVHNRVSAQVDGRRKDLQRLFSQAVPAEGTKYAELRDAIVARGAEAVPFLKEQCASKDRNRRILAAAMLGWINEPGKNKRREDLVHQVLFHSSHLRSDMLTNVRAEATRAFVGVMRPGVRDGGREGPGFKDELHEPSAVPFLLEIVLKGTIHPPRPEDVRKYKYELRKPTVSQVQSIARHPQYSLWAQWYAIAYVGGLQGTDVIPILTDLLQSSKSWELRTCAATGLALHRTKSLDAVEPLIAALGDEEFEVRRAAAGALRSITGQNFSQDYFGQDLRRDFRQVQEKYEAWWKENRERLLKTKK